jgi:hypothetical protein
VGSHFCVRMCRVRKRRRAGILLALEIQIQSNPCIVPLFVHMLWWYVKGNSVLKVAVNKNTVQ